MNKKTFLNLLVLIILITIPLVGCQRQDNGANLVINEVMSSNGQGITDSDGNYEDWLEIYNPNEQVVNLKGYYLSDKEDNLTKWQFPEITIEGGGYLLVWASGKDKAEDGEVHTNFSVNIDGETLTLTKPDGKTIVDQIEPIAIPRDVSYGRYPDGGNEWHFYKEGTSTPGNSNKEPLEDLEAPSFSHNGGFYSEEFSLALNAKEEGVEIYYTLDGSEPDPIKNKESTFLYSEPVLIKDQSSSPNEISTIPTIGKEIRHKWQVPKEKLFKGTVVRAKAIGEILTSEVITNTYFVTEKGADRFSLPVLSLVTNKDNLFDPEKGIYVGGKIFEEYLKENPDLEKIPAMASANYHQRGQEWERPVNEEDSVSLEYMTEDGKQALAQNIGIRIHGGASRSEPQKSLRLYAREEYGQDKLEYPFFKDGVTNYKRLILRNSGNEWGKTMFLDGYLQSLLDEFKVDTQKFQSSILFINGEYWGIHNIRERQDEYYLEGRYGVDPDKVTILENNAVVSVGKKGDEWHYLDLLSFIEENDLKDPKNYAYVQRQMDIDNFIDYQIINIFLANIDWPQNNVTMWRYNADQYKPDAPVGQDGRWRWLIFDLDSMGGTYGAGYWDTGERFPDYKALERATDPKFYTEEGNWPTFLLRKLLENPEFKRSFINRFADHLNTSFKPEVTVKALGGFSDVIGKEIGEHIKRWGYPNSYQEWEQKVEYIEDFMRKRPSYQEQQLLEYFDLSGTAKVTLKTDPSKGAIKINTIEIDEETKGVENSASWQGVYYKGVPVEITALAKPGYKFVGWEGDYKSAKETLEIDLNRDVELKAVFK